MTRHCVDEARRRAALAILDRLRRDARAKPAWTHAGRRVVDHFAARDAIGAARDGATDPVELWGRRIGRGFSFACVLGLCIYLCLTHSL